MESMSTEKTRAPSFASNAASGRPTTSDLCIYHQQVLVPPAKFNVIPVYHGDGLAVCTVTIMEDLVVHSDVFQAFYNSERRAG